MLPTISTRKLAVARQLRARQVGGMLGFGARRSVRVPAGGFFRPSFTMAPRQRRSLPPQYVGLGPGGDPGLFSFVGNIVKSIPGVGSVVSAVETGVKAVGSLMGGGGARAASIKTQQQPQGGLRSLIAGRYNPPFGGPPGAGFRLDVGPVGLEAGVGEIAEAAQLVRRDGRPAHLPTAGYHFNKSGYYVQDPSDPMRGIYIPPGTREVRNRRRNPFNPRALDRATSRIAQFARADQRSRKAVVKAARKVTPPRRATKKKR